MLSWADIVSRDARCADVSTAPISMSAPEREHVLRDGGSTGSGERGRGMHPVQRGFVEMTFPEAGNYPFVSHTMSDSEKGAAGVFHVTAG